MYYPALRYKPRIRHVKGRITHEAARYRRILVPCESIGEAAYLAIDFHSRFMDKHTTQPIVMSEKGWWFDYARNQGTEISIGPDA